MTILLCVLLCTSLDFGLSLPDNPTLCPMEVELLLAVCPKHVLVGSQHYQIYGNLGIYGKIAFFLKLLFWLNGPNFF